MNKSELLENVLRDVKRMERDVEDMKEFMDLAENEGFTRVNRVVVRIGDERGNERECELLLPPQLRDTLMTLTKAHYRERIKELEKELENIEIKTK